MKTITIDFEIGDTIELKLSGRHYIVCGWEYIESRGLRYICMDGTRDGYSYVSPIEISHLTASHPIGFSQ